MQCWRIHIQVKDYWEGYKNKKMIQPKISAVTVYYNAVNDIEKSILSVIIQTYPNIEYSLLMVAQRMV